VTRSPFLARALLSAVCAATLAGCSWGQPKNPGYLLRGVEMGGDAQQRGVTVRYFGVDRPERYYRFVVDPVAVVPAQGLRMEEELARRIADQFRRELVARLANAYEVVDHPGAGVLRLRAAIVEVRPDAGHGLAAAAMEAVITDSLTDELILAVRDNRRHLNQANRSLFSEWENAKSIMQAWATRVRGEIKRLGR
jgi:hypothetical protein